MWLSGSRIHCTAREGDFLICFDVRDESGIYSQNLWTWIKRNASNVKESKFEIAPNVKASDYVNPPKVKASDF
jgi:hypothetical protein